MKKFFTTLTLMGIAVTTINSFADENGGDHAQQTLPPQHATTETQVAEPSQQPADSATQEKKDTPPPPPQEELTKEEQTIKEMLRKNPFSDSVNSATPTGIPETEVQSPEGLELRGIARVDGEWIFFIHDIPAKLDYKIGLKQPITEKTPYTIDFYDDESNSVSISNNVTTYVITLKTPDAPSGKMPSTAKATNTAKTKASSKTAVRR